MKITNVKVYDLEESIVASGLPKLAEYDETECGKAVRELFLCHLTGDIQDNPHFKRACKLAANPAGSGHANFLSGILVSANVTATVKWWEQLQRYHFVQIVSSQSTMHRLRKMLENCTFTYPKELIGLEAFAEVMQSTGKDDNGNQHYTDEQLAYMCPMGIELTARITTNYLQLKTIKNQRKNHKLTEWKTFVAWIETLPFAKEFITGESCRE